MRLTVVGCSGSFPQPGSASSCYLVEADDAAGRPWRVVLDLGSGALGPLQARVAPAEIDAVFLTHLHPDHFIDLTGMYVALRYHPDGPSPHRLPVYGPAGTSGRVAAAYGPDPGKIEQVYDIRELGDAEPVRLGPFTITPRRVNHPVLAFGLRVEADGAVLAYSGDTDTCPALTELARDADLFLAEASFVEGRDDVRDIHLTGRRAGEVAAEAGVGRLVLTHIPVWTDPAVVAAEAAEVFPGPVECAVPGRGHDLHHRDRARPAAGRS